MNHWKVRFKIIGKRSRRFAASLCVCLTVLNLPGIAEASAEDVEGTEAGMETDEPVDTGGAMTGSSPIGSGRMRSRFFRGMKRQGGGKPKSICPYVLRRLLPKRKYRMFFLRYFRDRLQRGWLTAQKKRCLRRGTFQIS